MNVGGAIPNGEFIVGVGGWVAIVIDNGLCDYW